MASKFVNLITVSVKGAMMRPTWPSFYMSIFLENRKPFSFQHKCSDRETRQLTIINKKYCDPTWATARLQYPSGSEYLIVTGRRANQMWKNGSVETPPTRRGN